MTGFGRASGTQDSRTVKVEVRSVNHRFSDIIVKLPRALVAFEERVRKMAQDMIERGRVEITITIEGFDGKDRKVSLDQGLLQGYLQAWTEIQSALGQQVDPAPMLGSLMQVPDLFVISEESLDEDQLWPLIQHTTQDALRELIDMRRVEGERLYQDISARLTTIDQLVQNMAEKAPQVVEDVHRRLVERLKEWEDEVQVAEDRIAQEVVLLAEKANVDEELTRLRSHLAQMDKLCHSGPSIGRKLDFLLQEIFREINTIASKVHDQSIVGLVVSAKAEVEKIREQVQNVE